MSVSIFNLNHGISGLVNVYVRIHDKLFTFNTLNGMRGVSGFCQYKGLMWWISYPITSYDNMVSCIATVVLTS